VKKIPKKENSNLENSNLPFDKWKKEMGLKPNIDLIHYSINETDDLNTSEYQSDEVKWVKKELTKRYKEVR